MAHPFADSEYGDGSYLAALTTGERLFLVRAVADILELIGEEDQSFDPNDPLAQLRDELDFDPAALEALDALDSSIAASHTPEGKPWEAGYEEDLGIEQLEAVIEGLANHEDAPAHAPTDPALRRLLPDASLDPDVAAEFRKYTDFDLREHKVQRLLLLSERLTDVEPSANDDEHMDFLVDAGEAEAVAGALGDIRLVLGERLDLRSDEDSNALYDDVVEYSGRVMEAEGRADELTAEQEGRYIMGILFELAGFLQETLTQCMLDDLRAKRARN